MAEREHPILFSGPMVRAILAGRKTQTRRVVKPQPESVDEATHTIRPYTGSAEALMKARPSKYQVGNNLWVRETLRPAKRGLVVYSADGVPVMRNGESQQWSECGRKAKVIPSIFMPRWASRLLLEVKAVRVERVQDISEADAVAEGVGYGWEGGWPDYRHLRPGSVLTAELTQDTARMSFSTLWDTLNARRGFGWAENPWVVAVTFERVEGNRPETPDSSEGGEA